MPWRLLLLLLAALLPACAVEAPREEPALEKDAGALLDAAAAKDGGPRLDAGAGPDAQAPVDGGRTPRDAGFDGWQVQVAEATPVLAPGPDGCLAASPDTLEAGTNLEVLASDGRFTLIDGTGRCVAAADLQTLHRPAQLSTGRTGIIQNGTSRYTYDETGCPAPAEALEEGTEVLALARSHDESYRGFVVVDRDLGLAPVRMVDAEGWTYPWHASVQLVKEVEAGFVIGGGVVVGPNAILTAAHLGVDETWCYSREANSGVAWEDGLFECANIAGPAETHPDGVDVAIVHLLFAEPPPHATVRMPPLSTGDTFYSTRWSTLHRNAFADSTVAEVGNDNAACDPWPADSSFLSSDLIVGGGDSGGPAFVGDELVGLVHGEVCRYPWEPEAHVFVHLPGVRAFLEPVLP